MTINQSAGNASSERCAIQHISAPRPANDEDVELIASAIAVGCAGTPKAIIERILDEHKIGAWTAYAALYGTREQVDVNWKIVTDPSRIGEIVTEEQAGQEVAFKYRADLMRGNMTMTEFGLYNWRGGGGSMWFAESRRHNVGIFLDVTDTKQVEGAN